MSTDDTKTASPDILERNVSTLIETGGEPPRMTDIAKARVRAKLVAAHARPGSDASADRTDVSAPRTTSSRRRSPLVAVGAGLAAAAAAALIVTRVVGNGPGGDNHETLPVAKGANTLVDGSTWLVDVGGKVTELGPRHVRVEGAALLDVVPGKGTFLVETKAGRVEVLGTRFVIEASADRTTAAVVRGEVKLASADGEVTLHAGEQGVAEAGRPPSRGPAPRLSQLASWAAQARHRDEHDVEPIHHGTLFARDPGVRSHPPWGEEYPLPIAKLGVDIVVENQVARVALDQTFHNDADQALEGVYRFAIPPDAALQRLAMYVDGKLEESAVVERMRARRIYEELVYRRVDPALLEWAGTGRLNLRVYPLPARQDKRLVLAYTQSLPKLYSDYTISVPLPEIDQPVGQVDFNVTIKGCANCEVTSTSHQVAVAGKGDDAIVTYHHSSETIGDSLVLHVRDARKQVSLARQDDFLMVRAPVELPREAKAYRPRTWVILDDVSASRGAMERRAQTDLVDAFMHELDENDKVAVVAFDVTARTKLAPTRVLDVDRRALRKALAGEGDVGATDFAAALDAAAPLLSGVAPDDANIVYLGDGVITSGARNLDALRAQIAGKAHFIGVGVGDGPDTQTLEALAGATGGYATTIDLADDVAWRAFDLVAALHTTRVTGLDARLVDATGALVPSTLYLGSPQLADGEELELVAKLAGAGAPAAVQLTGTLDGAPWQRTVPLPATAQPAGYLPRTWAQRHIAARLLEKHDAVAVQPCTVPPSAAGVRAPSCPTEAEAREKRDEAIRQDVVALGKKYFLLSRHTSLLVLENDAMYAQYGVTKGAGDTWAQYALPATIPVVTTAPSLKPAGVADDAELVRRPVPVFYSYGGYDSWGMNEYWSRDRSGAMAFDSFGPTTGTGSGYGVGYGRGGMRGRASLGLVTSGPMTLKTGAEREGAAPDTAQPPEESRDENKHVSVDPQGAMALDEGVMGKRVGGDLESAKRTVVDTVEVAGGTVGLGNLGTVGFGAGGGGKGAWASDGRYATTLAWQGQMRATGWAGPMTLQRFSYPSDQGFDDLSAFVPALLGDDSDDWRAVLTSGAGKHAIDPAATALLDRARKALPAGVYRWGELEIAVDDARRLGWRRTTDTDLAETASFDGTTWTRRYAELGLDVTRTLTADDIALALAYLPVWIAEPAHYARWFDVHAAGKKITLSRGKQVAFVLEFDARDRLVSIANGDGAEQLRVTWGDAGPIAATANGASISVGFTGQAIGDAPRWAHGATNPGVIAELPAHLPAYWQAALAKETAGSPGWRRVQRQLLVAHAATNNRAGLFAAFDALRGSGGVELGDLVLASGGVATATTDVQFAQALAPFGSAPLARYLLAGRAYGKSPRPERLAPESTTGTVGALWQLRHATALLVAGKGKDAVDALLAMGSRALELRLVGAAATTNRYDVPAGDIGRAWDAVAVGIYKNVARAQAAVAIANRGGIDAAMDRISALVADLDLSAAPPRLDTLVYQVQASRRGSAGWQIIWTAWRDRVLAGASYDHVMALVPVAAQQRTDLPAVLARAVDLSRGDIEKQTTVARLAIAYGMPAYAETVIKPLLASHGTRELFQLAANIELQQGRLAEALGHLEAAQTAGADEAANVATVRAEMTQIIATARQLAVQSSGSARVAAVERAMMWGAKWRAIDQGNPDIDQQLGELQLAVGNKSEAWRQLSTVIERDPWAGSGYMVVADTFERQGKVADALDFWQQAIVIDQTNPTPRLRKAQALIALGKNAEGDALLQEIVNRKWHDMWSGVPYQARALLERGKQR